jgi:chemotaxis protein MotB
MARKKMQHEHANHERWLVSYADFITLLFAFFVVMFAASNADKGRAKQVAESVTEALEGKVGNKLAFILGGTTEGRKNGNAVVRGLQSSKTDDDVSPEFAELTPSMRKLTKELEAEIRAGRVEVNLHPRGLVISLTQAAFFPSGDDSLDPASYPILGKLADVIGRLPNPVRLEGHTDSMPIRNVRFRSNWELSAARSIALLQTLHTRFAIPEDRMAAVGYADTLSVASNDTEEGRSRNRRVEITILSEMAALGEPPKAQSRGH